MRKIFIITLLALSVAVSSAQNAPKPRLVVSIAISGMRYDYLLRFGGGFGREGFQRLIADGVLCERAIYDYLGTSTVSGLATVASGTSPNSHGVIGSHWYDHTTGEKMVLTFDKSVHTVGADELDAQVSPRTLIASSIGDCIKGVSPTSKVFSLAYMPTSAVIMGGFSADGAYWVSPRDGKIVSSTYYVNKLPEWVEQFNAKNLAENYSSQRWSVSHPPASYYNVLRKDITVDTSLLNFDFLTRKKYDYDRLSHSPGGNALIKDLAVQTIIAEGLGRDDATDFLSIVFDVPSIANEVYGSNSMEVEDIYYRLDMELAAFVSFLESEIGRDNLLLVVTSPHGASDPVNSSSRIPSGSFKAEEFAAIINGFLGAQLAHKIPPQTAEQLSGDSRWVLDFCNNQLYLNRNRIFDAGLSLSMVQMMVAEFAIQFSGVSEAITASSMRNGYFAEGVLGSAQRSFFARHSGDVIINLLPGWTVRYGTLSGGDAPQKISQSGSPYIYDTHVPLIFYGGGVVAENISRDVSLEDIAPTIAHIVGVAPPNASTGSPITEIYKR